MAKRVKKKAAAARTGKAAKKTSGRKVAAKKSKSPRKWSKHVNETSDAMTLESGVFKSNDPKKIARSVKRSASTSKRRKASPFQSAMSMLNFYINRGGKNLPASKKKTLEKAKEVLRELYGKEKE